MDEDTLRHWYHGGIEFVARMGLCNNNDLVTMRAWLEKAQRAHSDEDARAIGHLINLLAEFENDDA